MNTRMLRLAALGLLSAALSTPALAQNGDRPGRPGQDGNAGQQRPGQDGNRPPQGRGNRGGSPEMIADRMMRADADGDGKISKDEASGGNAQRMFNQADADDDGFVTRVEIVAFVEGASHPETRDALERHCKTTLAHYKCPRHFWFVDALPRNALGKLQKHLLKREHTRRLAGA